ncbi:MAG: 50S ribosomal protein L4 [Synergistales bacterium]|nr:50S ribosomal protein L4 [Synergistaceae bacterium]MDY6400594.1 50S ribosomal protein L4 [Synergistales bacterium]MDY6401320.1 50S ribosomal protein L4 [Synergistales bacterium]MDY6405309.1 50S ribosomal protein L4 [Synergistales bacterium]MDY6411000.1 50S ribosomal protein L4 [Synergistales bacterium]
MPFVKVYEFTGERAGEMELSDKVFDTPVHMAAIHQVVVAHLANCRQGTHSTKTRGDVSGGGKKPWRQKHTGRARQGSTRSPIWVHGGVAHGPHPRDYHQKVNQKVRQLALRSVLSDKVREDLMAVVKGFDTIEKPSTKAIKNLFTALGVGKTLVIYHNNAFNVTRSVRNLPGAKCINVASINVYDILNAKNLIVTPEVVAKIEEVYSK